MARGRSIIDRGEFGAIFRSLRHRRGYKRMPALAEALEREFGIRMSSQGLYGYENGRSLPPLETYIALMVLLRAPGAESAFDDAISDDLRQELRGLR